MLELFLVGYHPGRSVHSHPPWAHVAVSTLERLLAGGQGSGMLGECEPPAMESLQRLFSFETHLLACTVAHTPKLLCISTPHTVPNAWGFGDGAATEYPVFSKLNIDIPPRT
jgi:hypothetical protein